MGIRERAVRPALPWESSCQASWAALMWPLSGGQRGGRESLGVPRRQLLSPGRSPQAGTCGGDEGILNRSAGTSKGQRCLLTALGRWQGPGWWDRSLGMNARQR